MVLKVFLSRLNLINYYIFSVFLCAGVGVDDYMLKEQLEWKWLTCKLHFIRILIGFVFLVFFDGFCRVIAKLVKM